MVAPESRAPRMIDVWFNSSLKMRHPWAENKHKPRDDKSKDNIRELEDTKTHVKPGLWLVWKGWILAGIYMDKM